MMGFLVTQNWFYDVWFLPIIISNLILQLVNGYHSQDNATLRLLEEMNWYIVPLVNPDGYVYSHEWVPSFTPLLLLQFRFWISKQKLI